MASEPEHPQVCLKNLPERSALTVFFSIDNFKVYLYFLCFDQSEQNMSAPIKNAVLLSIEHETVISHYCY